MYLGHTGAVVILTYELIFLSGNAAPKRYPVDDSTIFIGRAPDCDIIIDDRTVSRHHAEVTFSGSQLVLRYLGSRDGIVVNGERVESAVLNEGDRIEVGDAVIVVNDAAKNARVEDVIMNTTFSYAEGEEVFKRLLLEGKADRAPLLYQLSSFYGFVFTPDKLHTLVLKVLLQAIPAQRAFILSTGDESSAAKIVAVRSRDGQTDGPELSQSLTERVPRKKIALVKNMGDSELQSLSDSDGSAMAAPLIGHGGILGVLYVDTAWESRQFSRSDLELFVAVAYHAGASIGISRNHEVHAKLEGETARTDAMVSAGRQVHAVLDDLMAEAEGLRQSAPRDGGASFEQYLSDMNRTIDRLKLLQGNMAAYARMAHPDRSHVDINRLVDSAVGQVIARARELGVAIEFHPSDRTLALVDAEEIQQVILNLIVNAIDACEQCRGTVLITAENRVDGCHIEFRDSGIGMPEEWARDITRGKVPESAGMGLSTSLRILQEHHGTLSVRSQKGKGSVVVVVIPHMNTRQPVA